MKNKGYTGNIKAVPIAIEYHGDGSVTLCKELVDEMLADKQLPSWISRLLGIHNG